jgi:phage/plasmid-like protein (TIGR03299 family)
VRASVQIKFTPIRVVCDNTLTIALRGSDKTVRVPHTRDVKERLKVAKESLELISGVYADIERDFRAMAHVSMDGPRLTKYVELVFPNPPTSKEKREIERVERDRNDAKSLFEKGKGNSLPGVKGSLWAAYNGIIEMVDHGRNKRTPEQHPDHIWFGGGYSLKVRAFEVAKRQMDAGWHG